MWITFAEAIPSDIPLTRTLSVRRGRKDLPEHCFSSTLRIPHRRFFLLCSSKFDDLDMPFSLGFLLTENKAFTYRAPAGLIAFGSRSYIHGVKAFRTLDGYGFDRNNGGFHLWYLLLPACTTRGEKLTSRARGGIVRRHSRSPFVRWSIIRDPNCTGLPFRLRLCEFFIYHWR